MSLNNLPFRLRLAVVIPLYKITLSDSELFALKNNLEILRTRDIKIICPDLLQNNAYDLMIKIGVANFDIISFGSASFKSIKAYNNLMLSLKFYDKFKFYSHILICQTDAVVFEDSLNEWMCEDYSYVGAPWFNGMGKPTYPLSFYAVGNGGLSLRRVNDFIDFLSGPLKLSTPNSFNRNRSTKLITFLRDIVLFRFYFIPFLPRINEDIFWGVYAPSVKPSFKVPDPVRAADFSFEVEPAYLYSLKKKLPFGCHAWEKYDREFWVKIFKEINMNHLELLHTVDSSQD